MFNEKPLCTECKKEIKDGEIVHIKMRYPKRRGMTEIKAYLKNEAQFTCQTCFENQ
ncbi:Fe3+ hydroxamate ABC transporter substrate-binding protein [Planococcus sp. S3-L1]|uniref:Fe3+ hydroxamate ABC transporter substrate-binding protein n=1 Tax=Planococcus sp. S3-L1 TaxID=3046200 RepID=UPI0024BB8056|nr:Fe3+ hydroxamate ABC transporter substrate-binding protein [Planococcus sp. S3-L1]MDJ0331927.1 Fe3+ hydroxamate ABC transporter substrate-binding protein [Planococcus sp. S3-L1]